MSKVFRWDPDKNIQLQTERGISFEVVLQAISEGKILDIIDHPNPGKYPSQQVFIIEINQYIYLVFQTLNFAPWGFGGFAPKKGFHPFTPLQNLCFAVLVPFLESDQEIFLKTIFPSRKIKKQYLGD